MSEVGGVRRGERVCGRGGEMGELGASCLKGI